MQHACTSPGSRSTPIVLSLVRERRIRSGRTSTSAAAAFFALGAAKATGRPVAITCTSGTAAANFAPAVIEAHEARVPLIVLTADRPPELRDVGAGQTIDQLKLYGDAVKWFVEVGVHDATPERLRWIRALACRAYWTALEGRPGPVHLNFPLREPLVLDDALPDDHRGRAGRRAVGRDGRTNRAAAPPPRLAHVTPPAARGDRRRALRTATPRSDRPWRVSPSAPAIRCSPIPSRVRATAPPRSPATTCCCATLASPTAYARSS